MKIIPCCNLNRKYIIKKIQKKTAKRIAEYTRITEDLPKEVKQFAQENADTLSRIGKRNQCRIEFAKGEGLFSQTPVINIYRKELHIHGYADFPVPYTVDSKKLEAALPDLNNKKSALEYIRKITKKVLQQNRKCFKVFKNYDRINMTLMYY